MKRESESRIQHVFFLLRPTSFLLSVQMTLESSCQVLFSPATLHHSISASLPPYELVNTDRWRSLPARPPANGCLHPVRAPLTSSSLFTAAASSQLFNCAPILFTFHPNPPVVQSGCLFAWLTVCLSAFSQIITGWIDHSMHHHSFGSCTFLQVVFCYLQIQSTRKDRYTF